MKYAHLLYNSSEKNQAGSVGFGVRCSTENISPSIVDAMEEKEIFTFSENGPALTPASLISNPEAIKQIVPTYFFQCLSLADKKRIFVLGRKIAVGFDYTFYLNGKSGRLGNYVVDTYIFDQAPSADAFEILLEDPAIGSNHFIPSSPVPHLNNLEMRNISLGHKPYFPEEEKPFKANTPVRISPKAIDLLFAYIQSRKEGKPVLAKATIGMPPHLMAELALLVPPREIENLTFITNHSEEGKKQGINIVFINEYYGYDVYKKQWVWVNLENEEAMITPESILFCYRVEECIAQGDFANVHNLVSWCLSDLYEKGKSFSTDTQRQLYNYLYDFKSFDIEWVAKDRDLRNTLNDYFRLYPEEKFRFEDTLQKKFSFINTVEELWEWIELILKLNPIDCQVTIDTTRGDISDFLFQTPENVRSFYERYCTCFGEVQKFIYSDRYIKHKTYLSTEALRPYWVNLYRYFFDDKIKAGNKSYLIEQLILDNAPSDTIQSVIKNEQFTADEYINSLLSLLGKIKSGEIKVDEESEKRVTELMVEALKVPHSVEIDFFELYKDELKVLYFTPLFKWQLASYASIDKENIKQYVAYLLMFLQNPEAEKWELSSGGKQVFQKLYTSLIWMLKNYGIPGEEVKELCGKIYYSGYSQQNVDRFDILSIVAGRDNNVDLKKIDRVWDIAFEIDDSDYLRTLFPLKFKSVEEKSDEEIDKFVAFSFECQLRTLNELWTSASNSKRKNEFRKSVLRNSKLGTNVIKFLTLEGGMTDEEAMAYLEKNFPKTYATILKSREPSIMQKAIGFLREVFKSKRGG